MKTPFLSMDLLVVVPPSAMNCDEDGRPKTAMYGGVNRLRWSSQSVKRAWRTAGVIAQLDTAVRTRMLPEQISRQLIEVGFDQIKAMELAAKISAPFGKLADGIAVPGIKTDSDSDSDSDDPAEAAADPIANAEAEANAGKGAKSTNSTKSTRSTKRSGNTKSEEEDFREKLEKLVAAGKALHHKEVVVYEQTEIQAISELVKSLVPGGAEPTTEQLKALPRPAADGLFTADVALFGRMRAAQKSLSVDAACAVAHAISATRARVESDYWTAVDDLAADFENSGSAHMSARGMGSGVMYLHLDIDLRSLTENLGGNSARANEVVRALVTSAAMTFPGAGRSRFGTSLLADYLRVARTTHPVSLVSAFETPANDLESAIAALRARAEMLSRQYGLGTEARELSPDGQGSLQEIAAFAGDTAQ